MVQQSRNEQRALDSQKRGDKDQRDYYADFDKWLENKVVENHNQKTNDWLSDFMNKGFTSTTTTPTTHKTRGPSVIKSRKQLRRASMHEFSTATKKETEDLNLDFSILDVYAQQKQRAQTADPRRRQEEQKKEDGDKLLAETDDFFREFNPNVLESSTEGGETTKKESHGRSDLHKRSSSRHRHDGHHGHRLVSTQKSKRFRRQASVHTLAF